MSAIILGTQLSEAYLTVSARGLAEVEHESERKLAEVDPVRAAEDELISAYAEANSIDYATACTQLIAQGKLD